MSCFTVAVPTLDPAKRVNYSFGLVLGVDEFRQDQAHHLEKVHRHHRHLHGFGTTWGLKVEVVGVDSPPQPEIAVTTGAAVSPSGHDICVPGRMCARLDPWLKNHTDELTNRGYGSPPFPLSLCLVLCYRECPTDIVPVPGEPCRDESDVMQPSRLTDDFELKLCAHDPMGSWPITSFPSGEIAGCPVHRARQLGEEEFGRFLRRLTVASSGAFALPEQLVTEVSKIVDVDALMAGTGPSDGPPLLIDANNAQAMMHVVIHAWLTTVLPALLAHDKADTCTGDQDRCVLLAEVSFTVSAGYRVEGGVGGITVDESRRPLLLPTQLLQEWLVGGGPVWSQP
jgi:hypothetical protein